jgi:hypothetical protein
LETLLEAFRAAASSKSAHPLAKLQPNTAATTKLQPDAFRDFIICYSLFERLSGSQADSLSRAVAVYDQGLQALKLHPEHNGFYEHLLVSKVAMMFSESSKKAKGISPGALKAVLEGGLREFPSNVFLMSVYLISESKAQLTGSLRLFFDEQLEATDRFAKTSTLLITCAISQTNPLVLFCCCVGDGVERLLVWFGCLLFAPRLAKAAETASRVSLSALYVVMKARGSLPRYGSST